MHGVSRFLTRRDKNHEKRKSKDARNKSRLSQHVPSDLYTIFTNEEAKTAVDKDGEKKVKSLLSRLQGAGITRLGEEQAAYALAWYPDDLDGAYDVLVLANESIEGELKDYDPSVHMAGAINRNMVTCYLDALLFAMFARLDSFEAMLYDNFEDEPRKKLAAVLRLWVNLLRTGRLIKAELTKHLQDSLAECGWEEAAMICQQDTSEAFTFITGALELPLLTLKMDIYHTGREDKEDDHKFVNERLLEVAIPEQEGQGIITLEDCLETYFNNRIEVKRFLQRQNTIGSIRSIDTGTVSMDPEKSETVHIESIEVSEPEPDSPMTPIRPLDGRRRTDSIFGQRYTRKPAEERMFDEKKHLDDMWSNSPGGRPRSASLLRKEVLMPAWQFFSLIPWYTDNVPSSDAQVAAHFAARRPVLGICLKRYTMLPNGAPKRLDTYIDIPLEIALPHFVSDDRMQEGPLFGNFKLVLQSVVCHRGVSVDSGHYISLVRANLHETSDTSHLGDEADDNASAWMRFDDLANPRVANVDIKEALRQESPYLLFYQVQPIDEQLASRGDPPSYTQARSRTDSVGFSKESLISTTTDPAAVNTADGDESEPATLVNTQPGSVTSEEPVGRVSFSSIRRGSTMLDELEGSHPGSSRGRTEPQTPDEQKAEFLPASRRSSRTWLPGSKSRPTSQSGDNRISHTLSRLTGRTSKDKLSVPVAGPEEPIITLYEGQSVEDDQQATGTVKENKDKAVTTSKSKKETKDRFRSKSRDLGEMPEKGKHKDKGKNRPERECITM